MPSELHLDDFLIHAEQRPVIDVRSPGEFARGHIPGATNIPLFDDEERTRVGACYHERGRNEAVLVGLDLVGPKMRSFVERTQRVVRDREPLVHCWRGGMRSGSFAWLLEQAGMCPSVLVGGYKSFRRAAHDAFGVQRSFIVLSGMTGAGKTRMLRELAKVGEQVIDLEAIAHHRGSSFGAIGQPPQPTCEQFENELFQALRQLHHDRVVWVEDESPSIGRVRVPDVFWWNMRRSPALFMEVDRPQRAKHLVQEYGSLPPGALREATERLQKKLGGLRTKQLTEALAEGRTFEVAFRLLEYYDKSYAHAAKKRPREHVIRVPAPVTTEQLLAIAQEVTQ